MNNWMSDPFEYPKEPINRGKVLTKADLDRLGGFARYQDVDGDGIGYRTLPGPSIRGGVFYPRHRTQRKIGLQRTPRRLRKEHGTHQQEIRDGAIVCSAS